MPGALRVVLGDQCSRGIAALRDLDPARDVVLLSEVVATTGLVVLIFALVRAGSFAVVPWAVGAYIGAAYWWTSSTSFANPAVTFGRMFSNTFAGIAPASVPGFVVAQLVGLGLAVAAVHAFYPGPVGADNVVVPRSAIEQGAPHSSDDAF